MREQQTRARAKVRSSEGKKKTKTRKRGVYTTFKRCGEPKTYERKAEQHQERKTNREGKNDKRGRNVRIVSLLGKGISATETRT